jgi:hypothetical protein
MKQLINTIESNTIARYGFESKITRIVFKATEIIKTLGKRG